MTDLQNANRSLFNMGFSPREVSAPNPQASQCRRLVRELVQVKKLVPGPACICRMELGGQVLFESIVKRRWQEQTKRNSTTRVRALYLENIIDTCEVLKESITVFVKS